MDNMDNLLPMVDLNGSKSRKTYYAEKKIGDFFQGLLAALLYHRPEDPVGFLQARVGALRTAGTTDGVVDWLTFLPPPGDNERTSRSHTPHRAPAKNTHSSRCNDVGPVMETPEQVMGPPGGRPASAGSGRERLGAAGGAAASGRANAVNPALLRTESTTTSGSADYRAYLPQSSTVESGGDSQVQGDPEDGLRTPDMMGEGVEEEEDQDLDGTLPSDAARSKAFWEVLRGSMSNLPAMPTNTVRIFLSSTFSDFKAERNNLPQFAYPRLEEFCAARGVDFQVVDMRWGVPDEVVHDHQVSPLCIAEIKTCQQLSCGPNFVVLLGDRYGWQGFPPRIQCEEFVTLMEEIQDKEDLKLVGDWFKRDDNSVPPEYILQSIHVHFKHYDDPNDTEKRSADQAAWKKVSGQLQSILRMCARSAWKKGTFTEEQKRKYFMSVTEEEILQGVFESDDSSSRVLCYHRSLQDLDKAPRTKFLEKFIDLTGSPRTIDKEAALLRTSLLDEKLRTRLPPANIKEYQVKWKDVPLEKSSEPEHGEYLKQFCKDFIQDIQGLVQKKLDELKSSESAKWMSLYHEALHHARFGQMKCEVFCGRQEEIQRIKDYLKAGKNGGHRPLVMHAISGMGKTALMAYIASRLKDWFGTNCLPIIRFLGTSPLSSTISETLRSVIEQLSLLFRLKTPSESSLEMFGNVRRKFHAFLQKVSEKTNDPVVLMLDSVDQLAISNGAHRMVWLPKVLPKNVYVIVSMLTYDRMGSLANTRKRIPEEVHYLELAPLSEFTGDQIIDSQLARDRRRLTGEQRQLVVDAFKSLRHPLFLKLVIDEAKVWTSYFPLSAISILKPENEADDAVKVAILKLFENMETKHGVTFVRHALGYLTCGKGGLTDIEMEDVLSCDDLVLNEVYQYHEPPLEGVIRIPSLLWSRLQHALKEYICERRVDGKIVLAWYHRQFWEAAETRYLQPASQKELLHKNLAELFLQETGIKRTITLHHFQGKVIRDADRRVKPQPLEPTNLRKLQAVPFHLYHALNHELLVKRCLINFQWLLYKLQAFNVNTVIRELEMMDVHTDVGFLRKFVEICFDALSRDSYLLAYNIVERMECCSRGRPHLETLVADAKKWLATTEVPLMVPTHNIQLQPADSPQLFSIMLGYDGLLSKDESMMVCTWSEMNTGITKIQTLDLKSRDIVGSVPITKPAPFQILPDDHHFVFAEDAKVGVYEMDSGDTITEFAFHEDQYEKVTVRCMGVSENGKLVALGVKFGKPKNQAASKRWRGECKIFLVNIEEQRVLNSISFRGKNAIDNLFFVQNDELLVGTTKNKLHVYAVPDLTLKTEFSQSHELRASSFQKHADRKLIVGLCSSGTIVRVLLFDYGQMDVRTSENVHIDGDQKRAVPFALHVKDDMSSFLVGSWGETAEMPLSSVCLWGPSEGKSEAYVKIQMKPRGYKAPNSLTTTLDWKYVLVGWQCGRISVIDAEKRQELQDISAHGHAIYSINLLHDGKTLVTASQDHSLKVWDLPNLLKQAHDPEYDVDKVIPLEDAFLHEKEQCLDLITCDSFIVSAPSNNLWAPRFWSYETGHLLQNLHKVYQELYDKSVENNKLEFPTRQHSTVKELPNDTLVYERCKRNSVTILVAQGFDEKAKILVHHLFEDTFFRLIIPASNESQKSILYAVHDGMFGVYDIMTLQCLKQVEIRPITKDIPHINSTGGKKRLLYYKVGVTQDERYFIIVNPGGGVSGKYMDVIQVKKGKFKKRMPLSKYTPFKFLSDGFYFMCKDKKQELSCFPAHICASLIEERGKDYDYRSLVLCEGFLSPDKSLGWCIQNKAHTIHVWQVEPLKLLHSLRGHDHEVTSIDISRDNLLLASGSYDNTVRLWDLTSGHQLCLFHAYGAIDGVKFSPSSSHVTVQCYSAPQRKRGICFQLKNIKK